MKQSLSISKKKLKYPLIIGLAYFIALVVFIYRGNQTSLMSYPIEAYGPSTDFLDLLFPLIVSLPFSYLMFYISDGGFLDYVGVRTDRKKFIKSFILKQALTCFLMVFLANFLALVITVNMSVAHYHPGLESYNDYLLGDMFVNSPLLFSFIWSIHKAFIGTLICIFGQIIALYSSNLFLTLIGPFIYVLLENFLTATLGLQRFSLTTAFILYRLAPSVYKYQNILIAILCFTLVIWLTQKFLGSRYEKDKI